MAEEADLGVFGTASGGFTTTHGSGVLAAGGGATPQAEVARERLCRTYWYPLYVFVRSYRHSPANAADGPRSSSPGCSPSTTGRRCIRSEASSDGSCSRRSTESATSASPMGTPKPTAGWIRVPSHRWFGTTPCPGPWKVTSARFTSVARARSRPARNGDRIQRPMECLRVASG